MTKLPPGKGMYIWQVYSCEGGDPKKIAAACVAAGFRHVYLKIADGRFVYPSGVDLRPLVDELHAVGIEVWGWQYVYLFDPTAEAKVAAARVKELNLDGFIIDAEVECKGRKSAAVTYTSLLRQLLPGVSIGLSSYRFPHYHLDFPWKEFRERVDFDTPQVYWEQAHNAGAQLASSYAEFQSMTPRLPYVPTGAAYKWNGWSATPADVTQFIARANALGLSAFNFWSWQHARQIAGMWEAIAGASNVITAWKLRAVAPLGLRIRTGPGTAFERVGSLTFGTVVTVDRQERNWARLADGRGWICTDWTRRV